MKTIRRAKPDEWEILSDLATCSKSYWGYSDEFMTVCRAELTYSADEIKGAIFFLLIDEDKLIGFYGLGKESDTVYELEALYVELNYIGQGYGQLLMDHAKRTMKAFGGVELIIQGDPNAADFYIKADGEQDG